MSGHVVRLNAHIVYLHAMMRHGVARPVGTQISVNWPEVKGKPLLKYFRSAKFCLVPFTRKVKRLP